MNHLLLLLCALAHKAAALEHAAFDSATATSIYGGTSSSAFSASQALHPGSGYWCSSGKHPPGQVITWTGILAVQRRAHGIMLHWAYSPGEIQVLASADGINFVEAACWRPSTQSGPSYVEHVMFGTAVDVRSVTVVMRGIRPWDLIGLSSAALLVEPGPFMLVSAVSHKGSEACVTKAGEQVILSSCLQEIARGSGAEVFRFTEAGLLQSVGEDGACVVADPAASGGPSATSCRTASAAEDGRASFAVTASGQLKVSLGNSCIVAASGGLAVEDCDAASRSVDARDKFISIPVPELDLSSAVAARASARLAVNTASRLSGIAADLKVALAKLDDCGGIELGHGHAAGPQPVTSVSSPPGSNAVHSLRSGLPYHTSLTAAIATELHVEGLTGIIKETRAAIAAVRGKM